MSEKLREVVEAARHDKTIPTIYPANPDCDTCKDYGRCICWTWQDEAEWRAELEGKL